MFPDGVVDKQRIIQKNNDKLGEERRVPDSETREINAFNSFYLVFNKFILPAVSGKDYMMVCHYQFSDKWNHSCSMADSPWKRADQNLFF